jgi:hypothetical protein
MSFELDHLFICTAAGAPEASRLNDFGLTEGPPNTHPGQGTANRRFFFRNAMLELIWVHDLEQARSVRTRPTMLYERWNGRGVGASPFGICLRPLQPGTSELPFPAFEYRPAYLPEPCVIHVGENAGSLSEPMLIYLAFAKRPDHADTRQLVEHAAGIREVTALRVHGPWQEPPSAALEAALKTGAISWIPGEMNLMEIGFDSESHGKSMEFFPDLPLIFNW